MRKFLLRTVDSGKIFANHSSAAASFQSVAPSKVGLPNTALEGQEAVFVLVASIERSDVLKNGRR